MSHQVSGKSIFHIFRQGYGTATMDFKIKGILVDKKGNTIQINVGNNKMIEAQLRNEIAAQIGDAVILDKKDILHSRVLKENQTMLMEAGEKDKYSRILDSLKIPVKTETLQAVRTLDLHGMILNKENIFSFITAKSHLDTIIEGMDYNTAIQLIDKEVDPERDSLQKVAEAMKEVKKEEKGFSFFGLFKNKKGMTTEEAERIAYKIYGSRMGKDITDIIKAIDKAGMEITKKNIEKVNDIFAKLQNLQNVDDETFIDSIKNKIEGTIDNLYKLKNTITKSFIAAEEKINQFAAKIYEGFAYHQGTVSDKDLKMMEEEIRERLEKMEMEGSEKNVERSKLLIKNGMEVSRENLEKIQQLRESLEEISSHLDYKGIAALLESGVEVDKEKIEKLAKLVQQLKTMEGEEKVLDQFKGVANQEIEEIMNQVNRIKKIEDKDLLLLLKRGIDIKLSDIHEVISRGGYEIQADRVFSHTVNLVETLNQLQTLNYHTIAFQLNNKLPLTMRDLAVSHQLLQGTKGFSKESLLQMPGKLTEEMSTYVKENITKIGLTTTREHLEIGKALIQNHLTFNRLNIQQVRQIEEQIQIVRENLSASVVAEGVAKGLTLEKMELKNLIHFINGMKGYMIPPIGKQDENILALVMKNHIPLSIKQVQNLSSFLSNRNQLGQQFQEMLGLLEKSDGEEGKKAALELKNFIKEFSREIKAGSIDVKRSYEELSKMIKNLEGKLHLLDEKTGSQLQKNLDKFTETLQLQNQLNKEDTVFQLPLLLNDHLKNLQIYIMHKKKGSRKIDPNNMSILMNIDTENMGNLNIYLGVNNRRVILKAGVNELKDKKLIEDSEKMLRNLLAEVGYDLKELSFKVEEDQHILSMMEAVEEEKQVNHFIDIKI